MMFDQITLSLQYYKNPNSLDLGQWKYKIMCNYIAIFFAFLIFLT